jgi:hypothetical protein
MGKVLGLRGRVTCRLVTLTWVYLKGKLSCWNKDENSRRNRWRPIAYICIAWWEICAKNRGSDLEDVIFTNKVISFILYFKTLAYLIISWFSTWIIHWHYSRLFLCCVRYVEIPSVVLLVTWCHYSTKSNDLLSQQHYHYLHWWNIVSYDDLPPKSSFRKNLEFSRKKFTEI